MPINISALTFDTSDALAAASFWAAALSGTVGADNSVEFGSVERADSPTLYFQRVEEPKTAKNRLHLDLTTSDLEGEISRLVGLGATVFASYDTGSRWSTLLDPDGNEFCVVGS